MHKQSGASDLRPAGAFLALAGINVIWGANFPFTKPALDSLSPFVFTLLRFGLATAVLLPLAGRPAIHLLRGPNGRRIVLMGVLGMCFAQVAQTLALQLSTASDISLLATASPVWIALLAWLWLGERLGKRGTLGFLLAVVGIVLVIWPQDGGQLGTRRVIGDLVFMITGFCWAAYNVLGKDITQRCEPLAVTTAAVMVGTLGIVPFAGYELLAGHTQHFTLPAAGGVAFAGLLVTALGFPVLLWALRHVKATQAGVLMYFQPLAGVLIAWALLGDVLTLRFFIGGALVLLGVGLVVELRFGRRLPEAGPDATGLAPGLSADFVEDVPPTAPAGPK